MNKKIKISIISVLIGTSLVGVYGIKTHNDKVTEQKRISLELQQKEQEEKELQEKRENEEAEARQKAEEEAKAKAEVKAKLNAEAEAKVKADAEVKAKAEAEALSKAQAAAPKQQISTPSTQTTTTASKTRPAIPTKHPVEYWTDVENEVIRLCNIERSKAGAVALSNNETLRQVARYKSNEMLQYNYFSHPSPITGFQPWDLASTFGWSSSMFGENIWMSSSEGSGQAHADWFRSEITAQNIVTDWMNSPGHRANILNKGYTKIGVGIAFSTDGIAEATQEFAN